MSVTGEWEAQESSEQWGQITKDSEVQTNKFEIYPESVRKPLK